MAPPITAEVLISKIIINYVDQLQSSERVEPERVIARMLGKEALGHGSADHKTSAHLGVIRNSSDQQKCCVDRVDACRCLISN